LKAYLSKVFVKTGLDVSGVELDVSERATGLYGYLPVSRVDRTKKVLSVDIYHFHGIFALYGPNAVGAVGGIHPDMEGGGLQQPDCMNTGDSHNDQT